MDNYRHINSNDRLKMSTSMTVNLKAPRRGAFQRVLLLLILPLLAGTVAAQSVQERHSAAERLFNEGTQLSKEGSTEEAVRKFEEAYPLFNSVKNGLREAATLNNLGTLHGRLGRTQKALDYYLRAVSLRRAIGDRKGEANTLRNLAGFYLYLGEKRKALDYLAQSISLFRALGEAGDTANLLTQISGIHHGLGEKRKALDYMIQALSLYRTLDDREGQAVALNNISGIYYELAEKQQSLDYLLQALPLYHELGDRKAEVRTLRNLGANYSDLNDGRKALYYYTRALSLLRAASDRKGEADTLYKLGRVYRGLSEKQQELDCYMQAVTLYHELGDRKAEDITLNNIGGVYSDLGKQQQALDYYGQALQLRRAVGDQSGEAVTLYNIGSVYDDLGETQKALDYLSQSLPLRRAVGDRPGEASTLSNMASAYSRSGEKQKALDHLVQALAILRAVADRKGEAGMLNNIGAVYRSIGEPRKALDYHEQALKLFDALGHLEGKATSLDNIGVVYAESGEVQKALDHFARALPLRRAAGDRQGEAVTLNNLGAIYARLVEPQRKLDYYMQALRLRRAVGDRQGEAVTLTNIGRAYDQLGESQKSLEYYAQALALYRAVGDRSGEAFQLAGIASIEGDAGDLVGAQARVESAIAIIESLRTKITNQNLRASYFATVQDYYEFNIDILMRLHKQRPGAGHDGKALEMSERAHARSLLEMLAEARADIRQGVDPTLVGRERSLRQQLNIKAQQQTNLLSATYTERTGEQAKTIAAKIEALSTELEQVETQIRQTSPRYAALTQPRPLTLKEIQAQVLDTDTLLLEYSLGRDRSYLWAVTPTTISSYELPKRQEVETTARRFYELLNTRNRIYAGRDWERRATLITTDPQHQEMLETATHLSRMLLGPVASQLGRKRIVIVADGALQYLPFAALPDPDSVERETGNIQPLIVKHEIANLPSVSILPASRSELAKRPPPSQTIAILADPVFSPDDERVKKVPAGKNTGRPKAASVNAGGQAEKVGVLNEEERFDRLPSTRKEAQGILGLLPSDKARLALDFNASRALAGSGELGHYRYVHFATHGQLNDLHPGLSSIVLSLVDDSGRPQNGHLRLNEIYNLNLPVDLVTLSGCETGLGKEIRGEGLVGLTRGFMYAGAARVLVSLWRADDEATAELMLRFYRGVIKEGKRPAEALRTAQIEMLGQRRWQAPYYWAAFVLQGEWR